ncbi:LacI family DNA-binding transcriptional regulator [Texcoconibacillus texcoconensis]|uniref:Catabolite control protein A n=1 Tax=Texcoconibacillus texcoconensis TaxID=1095777 RepID=A0A840QUI4_9BACI|nr:LacI family DNA-binding transcriptional regulator [Texcoconibacillus texcoconensis]MBB5175024.1 LacI family transcriptional regulator [Texcoconibacillus texcoconensis]
MERMSIKDVAKRANVSTATVSHVINETRFVSEQTKKRVYEAMRELDYQPNSVARSLRSRKTNTIGLLVPLVASDISNFFFMSIANGIEQGLKERGYNLILSNSNEDFETEKEQIKGFNTQLIDGLIIAPSLGEGDKYVELINDNYPVVFIDRKIDQSFGDMILVDNKGATYQAVQSLIEKGHKQIGMICGTLGVTTSNDRYESFQQVIADHEQQEVISTIKIGIPNYENGFTLAKELIDKGVTAIFVANNIMTVGAMAALQQYGKKIPQDVAIVGYDDHDWMKITSPPLSTVKQPSFELGKRSVMRLLERIEGDKGRSRIEYLPSQFIERSSS